VNDRLAIWLSRTYTNRWWIHKARYSQTYMLNAHQNICRQIFPEPTAVALNDAQRPQGQHHLKGKLS
jgi:hypothetical protein